MIRHVFRMIWNQRRTNAWIGAELLLISVVLWYVVDFMYTTSLLMASPLGFDIEHTYKMEFRMVSEQSADYIAPAHHLTTDADDMQQALDRIRAYPGVEALCLSEWGMPYSTGNSWAPLRVDTLSRESQVRLVTADFFRVFRLRTPGGKPIEVQPGDGLSSIVLTSDLAAELFPGQEARGRSALSPFGDSVFVKVLEVAEPLRVSEYRKTNYNTLFVIAEHALIEEEPPLDLEICIRVAADKDGADFAATFRRQMKEPLRIGNFYLMDVRPLSEIADAINNGHGDTNEVREYGSIAFFLLVNIFLGVLGTFWFRTQGRKGEMGLRIALGSTSGRLQGLLITEGFVLLTISFAVAMLIALNLTVTEVISTERMDVGVGRFLATAAITYAVMGLIIVAGIWFPARQTAQLAPADALHYE